MCMIDDADEHFQFYRESPKVARKDHQCYECQRVIHCGERYYYATAKSASSSIDQYHTCAHCHVAQEWLMAECGGFLSGGVGEDIHDHWLEGGHGFGLARLDVGISRKWRRFDGVGLMALPKIPSLSARKQSGVSAETFLAV